ncbi:MAG: DUF4058 family protein [Elainellaceae cyanobacterium]
MAIAFPGMNPYLENPDLWPEVHSWLIVELARSLNPRLVPKYRAAVEKRVYLDSLVVGIPDSSIFQRSQLGPLEDIPSAPSGKASASLPSTSTGVLSQPVKVKVPVSEETTERYLEIREVGTGAVVTVVEVLSPKNKRAGEGRNQYLTRRQRVLNSATHLVEIDLLRRGKPMPMTGAIASDYRVLISRGPSRPDAELYPFNLRDPMPQFLLPLKPADHEPVVNLNQILQQVCEQAALDLAIDYGAPPEPSVSDRDFEWMQQLQQA